MDPRREQIRDRALAAGFDAVGFAPAVLDKAARARLADFIANGMHGDMGWMAETKERRGDPAVLWPDAKSVIVLGINYGPAHDPLAILSHRERAAISVYAQARDYHDVIKKRLRAMASWMQQSMGGDVKIFADTAPVMEKPLAQSAGLGWQGKHTNIVSREFGSWLFLGEIFTTLDLGADLGEIDHCGACRRCLDICPTGAFPEPYRLDARRCISYLTIEHKGSIPAEFRAAIGNRIYGCDDCLAICPWNKFAQPTRDPAFQPRPELTKPLLAEFARLDDAAFRQVFSGSPIKRIKRDRFVRNVLIAIGNSGDPDLIEVARERLGDASPLVRAMAIWALSRLMPAQDFARLRENYRDEADPEVRTEWNQRGANCDR